MEEKQAKRTPAAIALDTDENPVRTPERDQELMAKLATNSSYPGTGTQQAFLSKSVTALSTVSFVDQWKRTMAVCRGVVDGDMTHPETMLMTQAMSLEAVFNQCASLASLNLDTRSGLTHAEALMRMALKAQAQCTQTLRVLGELKNPKAVAFIKQQNNTAGPQQVNNGPVTQGTHAHASEETQPMTNELITDKKDGQHAATLDTGATGRTVREDQTVETVGAVNRAGD